ncbi:MAG TPA: hypothetical protein DEP82_17415 [Arthrobacter bacterium]|nr:hypothetical protein [Arthrobacter sp.]
MKTVCKKKEARMRTRIWIAAVATVTVAIIAGSWIATIGGGDAPGRTIVTAGPYVGGDLHVLTVQGERMYVGGHDGAAVSGDGGRTWTDLPSLKGADPMGATATDEATLIAGHPGLFRSSDGTTFAKVTGEGDLGDVHALGGAGDVAYAGTPERGLLVSKDGGTTWTTRNAEAGRMFMGVILVDPADPLKLIAPDMSTGLVTSKDGGITWTAMGGPGSAMAAAWDPIDTQQLVVVGMTDSAQSSDGGATWTPLMMPKGASAATFSADGKTLYAAALSGMNASVYASTDLGRTWGRRSGPEASEN